MRGCACLDPDKARRQLGEEPGDLCSLKPSADHNVAGGIDAMDLKYALRKIEADGGNLHDGRLPSVASPNDDHFRHSMPFSGGRPPHQLQRCCRTSSAEKYEACPEATDGRRRPEGLAGQYPPCLPRTADRPPDLPLPVKTLWAGCSDEPDQGDRGDSRALRLSPPSMCCCDERVMSLGPSLIKRCSV